MTVGSDKESEIADAYSDHNMPYIMECNDKMYKVIFICSVPCINMNLIHICNIKKCIYKKYI